MISTDYEWFESYEGTIGRYFAENADCTDGDDPFIDDDEDEFGEMPIS